MNTEMAEIVALQALGWLAGNEDGLKRFLSLSGMDAGSLRTSAGTADMNVAVLDFLLGHEDLLMQFCESAAISPRDMHLARHRLGGEV
jgi:hypothetical protein